MSMSMHANDAIRARINQTHTNLLPRTPKMSAAVALLTAALILGGGAASGGGQWETLMEKTGVSAMHMQLLIGDRLIFFDRTDFGPSGLPLPAGFCRDDPSDTALRHDCTAHAAEFHVPTSSLRPLTILTDSWCSSGTVSPNGVLIQTGGYNDGERAVRKLRPCAACDWEEDPAALTVKRWYATSQALPDGRAAVFGGRGQFNYELYPSSSATLYDLPFLRQTKDPEENNLYPFVHLNVDGNLFIFANDRAILLDYKSNKLLKTYPRIPGGGARNYPSTGSSVLLPIGAGGAAAEVLVCGGAPPGAYQMARQGQFLAALGTCGRLKITDESPQWEMEQMPSGRVMADMILLPNGEVLILNGGGRGTAGWELGRDPVLNPVIYQPAAPPGSRFKVDPAVASTARMYHSAAVLLRDGRVVTGGSNPHRYYNFSGVLYPTETSLEAYSPEYMTGGETRPEILPPYPEQLSYGARFSIRLAAAPPPLKVTMVAPSFTTHSFAMNQRLLELESSPAGSGEFVVDVVAPPSPNLAPPGFYLLFAVSGKVPSVGVWVHIT